MKFRAVTVVLTLVVAGLVALTHIGYPSGGHVEVGHQDEIMSGIAAFLGSG
jgi:hypothetical protein